MEAILVLAHTEADGSLAKPALEALAAALALGGEVTVGIAGASTQAAADQVASSGRRPFPGRQRRGVRGASLCD